MCYIPIYIPIGVIRSMTNIKMELFAKIVNGFQPLTVFAKIYHFIGLRKLFTSADETVQKKLHI